MSFEDKIWAGLNAIDGFLENANDTTLNFLNMTPEQRDIIVACETDVIETNKAGVMAVSYDRKDNESSIYFDPNLTHINQNVVTKILAHEVGHVFQSLRTEDKLATASDNIALRILYNLNGTYVYMAGVEVASRVAAHYTHFNSEAIYWGMHATAGVALYPARMMEQDADRFADKLVPEVPYEEMEDSLFANQDKVGFFKKISYEYSKKLGRSRLGPIMSAGFTHPSSRTRIQNSISNCEKYLEEKQRLNIPSLYIP